MFVSMWKREKVVCVRGRRRLARERKKKRKEERSRLILDLPTLLPGQSKKHENEETKSFIISRR